MNSWLEVLCRFGFTGCSIVKVAPPMMTSRQALTMVADSSSRSKMSNSISLEVARGMILTVAPVRAVDWISVKLKTAGRGSLWSLKPARCGLSEMVIWSEGVEWRLGSRIGLPSALLILRRGKDLQIGVMLTLTF